MAPRIPVFEESRNAYPESPQSTDVGVERFGRDAAALAQLGGEIGNFGARLIQARKDALEADFVLRASQEDLVERTRESERAKQEFTIMNEDGSVSFNSDGYAERMKRWGDERVKRNMELAPTGDAQRAYLQKSGSMFTSAYDQDVSWENVERTKGYLKNLDQEWNKGIIQLGETPNLFDLSQTIMNGGDWLNKSSAAPVNGAQKADLFRMKGKEAIFAFFDGLSKNKEGIERGLDIIKSFSTAGGPSVTAWREDGTIQTHDFNKEGDNTYLLNFLNQKDVQHLYDDLTRKKTTRSSVELRHLRKDMENLVDMMSSGRWDREADTRSNHTLELLKGHISETGPYTMRDWQEDAMIANVAKVSAQFMQAAAALPTYEKGAADVAVDSFIEGAMETTGVPKEKWPEWSFAVRERFQRGREALWKKLVKERNADPVAYMQKYDIPGASMSPAQVAQGARPSNGQMDAMLAAQKALGIEKPRLLSNAAAKAIKEQIEGSQNPAQAGQMLLQINSMGKYSKKYMDELVKHGKLDEKYRAVTMVENDDYAKVAIESFREKDVTKILTESGQKDKEKSLQAEVVKQYDSYFKAMAGAGEYAKNANLAQSIRDVVAFDARVRVAKGMPVKEAVQTSMDKLIKQSFDVRHNTLVPRSVGGEPIDPRKVEGEMNLRMRKEWQEKNVRRYEDKNLDARLTKALDSARWTVNNEQTGARLEVYDKVQKVWVPVMQKNGEPVFVDYLEADKQTSNNGLRLAPEE